MSSLLLLMSGGLIPVEPVDVTLFAEASDGELVSSHDGGYTPARDGTGNLGVTATDDGTTISLGQRESGGQFWVWVDFFNFDVSSISAGSTIDSATLSVYLTSDSSTTDFTIEARSHDWGNTLESGDWVPGANLSGLTLLASLGTNGIGATDEYKALTSEAALAMAIESAIAGDGVLRLLLCSSRTTNDNAPIGLEAVVISSADEVGTTQDPKLDVTYTPAG